MRLFGHGHCHPLVLAQSVLAGRKLLGVRFYSGIHLPRKRPELHAMAERRHALMRRSGVTVVTRPLRYRWEWGFDPNILPEAGTRRGTTEAVDVKPYERAREKGIDLSLALDVVDLALEGFMDVAVIISNDTDITEAARVVHQMTGRQKKRVSVEAAVLNVRKGPVVMQHYDFTTQLTTEDFDAARDSFNYRAPLDQVMEEAFLMSCEGLRPQSS
jgi:uncharacterized LabA/DUF88 family protein